MFISLRSCAQKYTSMHIPLLLSNVGYYILLKQKMKQNEKEFWCSSRTTGDRSSYLGNDSPGSSTCSVSLDCWLYEWCLAVKKLFPVSAISSLKNLAPRTVASNRNNRTFIVSSHCFSKIQQNVVTPRHTLHQCCFLFVYLLILFGL